MAAKGGAKELAKTDATGKKDKPGNEGSNPPSDLSAEKTAETRIREEDGLLYVESGFDPDKSTCAKARHSKCKDCYEDDPLSQPGVEPCLKEKNEMTECATKNPSNSQQACKAQQEAYKNCGIKHKRKPPGQ